MYVRIPGRRGTRGPHWQRPRGLRQLDARRRPSRGVAAPSSRSPSGPPRFAAAVLRAVRRIPAGHVATYGDVADLVGRPGAARAVARVLAQAEAPGVPYHRVVGSDGRVGGARGGDPEGWRSRARRLRAEGVAVAADGRIAGFARRRLRPPG